MSEKVKDILAMNLQINLVQLEEQKAKVNHHYFHLLITLKNFSRKSILVSKDTLVNTIKLKVNYIQKKYHHQQTFERKSFSLSRYSQ